MCRGKTSECDVPEYCNGSSQFCPPDVFIQNGYPCQNSKAYCYNGMCQYYDAQCQVIFGSSKIPSVARLMSSSVCFRFFTVEILGSSSLFVQL